MSTDNTRKKPRNGAKSIVSQPLFRNRVEKPEKGKGSYRRERNHSDWGDTPSGP